MDYVKLAKIVAMEAHAGQLDKGGNDYINHPATVASFVASDTEKAVAWLHDVVEDTSITTKDLLKLGFTEEIVDAVDAITRRENEDRDAYLERVKNNEVARVVKIADLKHNSDLSRISSSRPLTDNDYERSERYRKEMEWLLS